MPHVVSKLAAGVDYVLYEKTGSGKLVAIGAVSIDGGASVANKKTLYTPDGVVTPISDQDAEMLALDPVFQEHLANGSVKLLRTKPGDPDKAAADLDKDQSAPVTPGDYDQPLAYADQWQKIRAPKTGKVGK